MDFGRKVRTSRVELAIYDDRGGVQAPKSYTVEFWDGNGWKEAAQQVRLPTHPVGGVYNEVRFSPVETTKIRVVFTHSGKARSGVSEMYVWED